MTTESSDSETEAETAGLYALPLPAFVEARNALSSRLRSRGDKDGAARVKALARPNLPAWAANQVYWKARAEFDAFVAAVERLQQAQLAGGLAGNALRESMKARREAHGVVLQRAQQLLAEGGHAANPDTLRRVSNTIEALAAAHAHPGPARPGRLAQDLEPPGFDAFAAVAEAQTESPGPTVEKEARPPARQPSTNDEAARAREGRAALRDQRTAELAESEKRLEAARRASREAAGALSVAEKRAEAARGELTEATRRFERAQERAGVTAEEESEARKEAAARGAARELAEAERDAALSALKAAEQD